MIEESDNNSKNVLEYLIDKNNGQVERDVYTDLGLTFPGESNDVDFMTIKPYSYFFRVLYNGSYLWGKSSEYALHLLSLATFTDGISSPGAIPATVPVSHKFGERVTTYSDSEEIEADLFSGKILEGLVYIK